MRPSVLRAVIGDRDIAGVHRETAVDLTVGATFPVERFAHNCALFGLAVAVTINDVIAGAAINTIVTRAAVNLVVAVTRNNSVVTGIAVNQIIIDAFAGQNLVIGINHVAIRIASIIDIDQVVACGALNRAVKIGSGTLKHKIVDSTRAAKLDFHAVNTVHVKGLDRLAVVRCRIDPLGFHQRAALVVEPHICTFLDIKEGQALNRCRFVKHKFQCAAAAVIIRVRAVTVFGYDQNLVQIVSLQIFVAAGRVGRIKDHGLVRTSAGRNRNTLRAILVVDNGAAGKIIKIDDGHIYILLFRG